MRRRRPNTIKISRTDQQELKRLLSDGRTQQRVVRRAQVLLAMKNQKTVVDELCQKVQMTRVGIWYLCRRYEKVGLNAIYDAARSGRPREISALERVAIEQLASCVQNNSRASNVLQNIEFLTAASLLKHTNAYE